MGRKPATEEDLILNHIEDNRTRLGWSRQELADRVGVHYQTMGYLERGEYSPSLVLALRLAQALGVTIEQLFSLKEETNHESKE
jgi:DNA-binding XRE family transcriptional regulator